MNNIQLIIFSLAGGLVVGSSFAAFITVLDIVPRLAQLTKSYSYSKVYDHAIVGGVLTFTMIGLTDISIGTSSWILIPVGLFMGAFMGMIAGALTEVVNVIPVLTRRLKIQDYVIYLVLLIALAKVLGSLFQWTIFKVW